MINFQFFKKETNRFLKNYLLTSLLIGLVIWSVLTQNFFLSNFEKAKQAVARWPQLSKPHLMFALALFQTGNEQTLKELELGKNRFLKNDKTITFVEEKVTGPEQIKKKIASWERAVEGGLQNPQVYLELSLLNFKIYEDNKALQYWEKANYLDPNSDLVNEVGKIVN